MRPDTWQFGRIRLDTLCEKKEDMGTPESKVHSFIVKLWQEDDGTGKSKWHGYITHVPDAARRYFQDVRDIIGFIKPYLADDGAEPDTGAERPGWLRWARRKR